jgi:hypothetical protein
MRSLTNRTTPAVSPESPLTVTVVTVKPRDPGPGLPHVVTRRLDVARVGLAELRRCLLAADPDEAALLLDKLDEDLLLLQRRLCREAENEAVAGN